VAHECVRHAVTRQIFAVCEEYCRVRRRRVAVSRATLSVTRTRKWDMIHI
jgi:hypothetical protein